MCDHIRALQIITEIRDVTGVEPWMFGGCYNLFVILRTVFPEAVPYYDKDHIITRIGNRYYDITGQVKKKRHTPLTSYHTKKDTVRMIKQLMKNDNGAG